MADTKDINWLIDNVLKATGRLPIFSVFGLIDLQHFSPTENKNNDKAGSAMFHAKVIDNYIIDVDNISGHRFRAFAPTTLTGSQLLPALTDDFNKWMEKHLALPRKLDPRPQEI
ncbi:hypothetical protein MBANPS3_012160 [Mucor bainieri]